MGATSAKKSVYRLDKFQSTRPRGARLVELEGIDTTSFDVSIHAPAMGATSQALYRQLQWQVSIHAPAMGATQAHINSCNITGAAGLDSVATLGCAICSLAAK